MKNRIRISSSARGVTTIDIEGIIGTPEHLQFADESEKVATYNKFRRTVEQIAAIAGRRVVVNIRSMGGSVADALLIYDALCALPGSVTTRCWGYVASAATIIAQGASPGCREMSANALYLIHRSMSSAHGNGNDLCQTVDLLNKTDRRIASIYAVRSGKSAEEFMALMNQNNGNGRWLSPQEALEASLVDRIIDAAPIENSAGEMALMLGLPPLPLQNAIPSVSPSMREEEGSESESSRSPQNDTNLKINHMTLLEKWNAILHIIAQNETPSVNAAEDAPGQVEELRCRYIAEVEALQARIDQLEAQNAGLKARPTATKPREDASLGDLRRTPNQEAYEADIKMFK